MAEMLAAMLPTPELLAAWYLAEMRIHGGATFMPSERLRQRAAALAAAVPPAVLLAAAGLAAAELFHGHPVTLHHLARRAAAAPLLDARQARRTLPLMACNPAPMRPARQFLVAYLVAGGDRVQAARPLLLQPRLAAVACGDLPRHELALPAWPRVARVPACVVAASQIVAARLTAGEHSILL
jgi:hypothetical protein